MCGIIFVSRQDGKPASKSVAKRYKAQSERGSDGFGYIAIDNLKHEREALEKDILKKLKGERASEIMFHHRFPTSTPNIAESAHPIRIANKKLKGIYYVVHNGVISNDESLKLKHERMGYKYSTEIENFIKCSDGKEYSTGNQFNDSEALAIEVALVIEGKQKKIEANGATAFIALQVINGNPTALYYGRNDGNPLKSFRDKTFWTLASEGQGVDIETHTLYRYDYKTKEVSEQKCEIGYYTMPSYTYPSKDTYSPKFAEAGYIPKHHHECPCASCTAKTEADMMTDTSLEAEIEYIRTEIKRAQAIDDYDREAELKEELTELEAERDYTFSL